MNAIILVAGIGQRFDDLTIGNNKALLPVGGIAIVERIIQYLHEANIHDITLITGHMHHLFLHLGKKYTLRIIRNKSYSVYNNLYSLALGLPFMSDTFLIHGDVIMFKNMFKIKTDKSFFYTVLKKPKGTPMLHPIVDRNRKIVKIETCDEEEMTTSFLGVSYWKKEDSAKLKAHFMKEVTNKKMKKFHLEWESELHALVKSLRIEAHQIDSKYARDINDLMDYLDVCLVYEEVWKKSL